MAWLEAGGLDLAGTPGAALADVAEELRGYLDEHPEAEDVLNALGSWLARADDEDD